MALATGPKDEKVMYAAVVLDRVGVWRFNASDKGCNVLNFRGIGSARRSHVMSYLLHIV